MIIRGFRIDDLEACFALAGNNFGLECDIYQGNHILVADTGAEIAGFVSIRRRADNEVRIAWMAVAPNYTGRAVGKQLLEAVFKIAREGGSYVSGLTTTPAYFTRFGFDTEKAFAGGWYYMINKELSRRPL